MSYILLYPNVNPYFLDSCDDLAYPVLKGGRNSQRLFPYMRWIKSQSLSSLFYGDWTKRLQDVDEVFILDSAFDWSLPSYIAKANPQIDMTLIFWNPIREGQLKIIESFKGHGTIATYNKDDADKFGLEVIESFYSKRFAEGFSGKQEENGIVFLGRDKGRAPSLSVLSQSLKNKGIDCDFMVLGDSDTQKDPGIELIDKEISYRSYCRKASKSRAILDVAQSGIDALNLRAMESIFLQKKLITNNKNINRYAFYRPENICIIEDIENAEIISRFMEVPFVPYPQSVLDDFDINNVLGKRQAIA